MKTPQIGLAEWMTALKNLDRPRGVERGCFTTRMLRKAGGYSEDRARGLIRAGIDAGMVCSAGVALIDDISGRPCAVPVYRMIHEKRGKK